MAGGGGAPTGGGTSGTNLYNWKDLLPPWTQTGQQVALPWLMGQAFSGGMTPTEQKQQWGTMVSDIDNAAAQARKGITSRWVQGGAAMNSPAYNAPRSAVEIDRMSQVRKAAADFAKIKFGAKESAIKNMLTGLYTPPPSTTGQWSTQTSGSGGK